MKVQTANKYFKAVSLSVIVLYSIGIILFIREQELKFDKKILLITSVGMYLMSHFFRVVRLLIVVWDNKIKTRDIITLSLTGDTLGSIVNKIAGESVKIILFSTLCKKSMTKMFFALLYCRCHDMFLLSLLLGIFIYGKNENVTSVFMISVIGCIFLIVFLLLFTRILTRLESHYLKLSQAHWTVQVTRVVQLLKRQFKEMKLMRAELFFISFLCTSAIWLTEFYSLYVIVHGYDQAFFSDSIISSINKVVSSIFVSINQNDMQFSLMYGIYTAAIGLVSLVMIYSYFLIKKRKL